MSLIQAVDKWNKERQAALIQSYEKEGLRASGRWAASLEGSTKQEGTKVKSVILGEAYTGALVGGRKPTSPTGPYQQSQFTLREAIAIWIRQKGITPYDNISKDSLAFLIARKIHREGIKVPNQHNSGNLINNAFTANDIADLEKIIIKELAESMTIEVLKAVKQ